jgi:hypothetical protein
MTILLTVTVTPQARMIIILAQITASYQQANQKYEAKQQELERAERQALLLTRQ